jgi:myosin-5
MLLKWRLFRRIKKGTVRFQALLRGYQARKLLAAIKVQKVYRRYIAQKKFKKLRSAVIALQCATRSRTARRSFAELKKEQKDVGKLKANNEKLKEEMASLRAMLAAQAKESAAGEEHKREIQEKEDKIAALEKRIAEIEKELAAAKQMVEKLEADMARQGEESSRDKEELSQLRLRRTQQAQQSPKGRHGRKVSGAGSGSLPTIALEGMPIPSDLAGQDVLAEYRSRVAILEEELEEERRVRRQADGEVIKLRAEASGVKLNDDDLRALLAPQLAGGRSEPISEESSFADDESPKRYVFPKPHFEAAFAQILHGALGFHFLHFGVILAQGCARMDRFCFLEIVLCICLIFAAIRGSYTSDTVFAVEMARSLSNRSGTDSPLCS